MIATAKHVGAIALALCMMLVTAHAQAADKVYTQRGPGGWKLKVNGKDFFVKGVVWGYTPKNENYTFNLWGQPDAEVQRVLDYEFGLMKKAGVNAIRSFATIPPKWVTYIYRKYGIMTAINPLMGRYGATINGVWKENTDYSDPNTRKVLKKELVDTVKKYRNVPGVLMYALGNESNYGLSWKSFEIENLPEGEQNKAKAKYLYSMFAEAIASGKRLDPHHPFTIVNGDVQYLDLIRQYGRGWDLLGVNAYRGKSFTDMWRTVKNKYGRPILFFEFGADAFNSRKYKEDQASQAEYLRAQWHEMYRKSYGKGEEGNALGGFVFEWRDEWWKYKQTENLDKHDRKASWGNGGYKYDYVEGENNMNEEWWGITRMGRLNKQGFYDAEPRMAYDVLQQVWRINPYASSKGAVNTRIRGINMAALAKASETRRLETAGSEDAAFRIAGATIRADAIATGYQSEVDKDGVKSAKGDQGLMAFVDFEFAPTSNFRGDFTVNLIADSSDSDFEFKYGDRIHDEEGRDARRIELYDFQATLETKYFDLLGFYHVPRYHWGYKGDFFNLLEEASDMDGPTGQDIWNAKAPYGVEFVGKGSLDGLNIVAGPEIYWGANPKVIAKYQFGDNKQYTIMYSHDLERAEAASGGSAIAPLSNQGTIQGKFDLGSGMELQVGAIVANSRKVGEKYDMVENGRVVEKEIESKDTLGAKMKLSFNLGEGVRAYIAGQYAGLVADAGEPLKEMGTQLPYAKEGNKKVLEAGILLNYGSFSLYPRVFYRDNLVEANPYIHPVINGTVLTGLEQRHVDDDPFAVLGNRAARAAEIYFTYDPTPATPFYAWDNDMREDAKFAFNLGFTSTQYKGATDLNRYVNGETGEDAVFNIGLDPVDTWLFKSKMVFNPSKKLKAIVKLEAGKQQSTGEISKPIKYRSVEGKFIIGQRHIISTKFKKDGWGVYSGPLDFERIFNITYPKQYALKYTYLLDKGRKEKDSSKIGAQVLYRTLDENSPGEYYQDGKNTNMFEAKVFLEYKLRNGG